MTDDDPSLRLIDVAEDLDEIESEIADLDIFDSEELAGVASQMSDLCLDLSQAIDEHSSTGSESYRLEDDDVLTDGGRYQRRQRPIDRTFRLRCDETDQEFFKELDGSYLEAAKLDGEVEVYCGFCGREHVLEVIAP